MVRHGSIAQAGKVRSHTPHVPKKDKGPQPSSRVRMRRNYNVRFLSGMLRKRPNSHAQ